MHQTENKYYQQEEPSYDKQFTTLNQNLRVNFIRKVLGIVAIQLLATFFMSYLTLTNDSFYRFQVSNPSISFFLIAVTIVTMLMLTCSPALARNHPTNYLILAVFTLAESYSVSSVVGSFQERTVLMALFLTATVVSSLTLYAMTTKKEVGFFGGLIVVGSSAMLMCLLGSFIFGGDSLSCLISIISAVMAGLYLIYDIQMLMGNDKRKISLDDHVLGAMIIYLDVVRIFFEILKFLNKMEDDKDKRKRKN